MQPIDNSQLILMNSNRYHLNSFGDSKALERPGISPVQTPEKFRMRLKNETRKNGLIERFYNFCKNSTGIGAGSQKIKQSIDRFEQGKANEQDVNRAFYKYNISQKSSEQNLGNLASSLVALTGFFGVYNFSKLVKAQIEAKAAHPGIKALLELPLDKRFQKYQSKIKDILTSNKKTVALALPFIMLASGLTKWALLKFNRIQSEEFNISANRPEDKKYTSKVKRSLKRERHKANFRNFCTGAINGLLAPIAAMGGGIIGIPAYILATSGITSAVNKKDKKDNVFNNYFNTLKNSAALSSLFIAALAIPAVRKAQYSEVLSKNLKKVIGKLKDVKLKSPNFKSTKTAYEEIEDIILKSEGIKSILEDASLSIEEKISRLTENNLFAVKFLQISDRGEEVSSMLIENCPASRSISEAQSEINKLLKTKYKVTKLLGVGTVAESYLAKDSSGKEVCIKILKSGINTQKVQQDKKSFIEMVTGGKQRGSLTKAQEYLVRNVENMYEALLKEIDFENEMKAAQKLKKSTRQAEVVVPIEAKQGIYVMERAPGISLDTLVKYYQYENAILFYKKLPIGDKNKIIAKYEDKIKKLKERSPEFKDFNLSAKEIDQLLKKYIDVLVEQFTKISRNGKTLHADIHPGNIFINLEALKTKKGKLFTLIDTGNTIDLTKEQAIAALKLTTFIQNGNVKDITKYILDGAILPKGMSPENAAKLVEQDFRRIFFDNKTTVGIMTVDELFKLTNNILREHDIIPNDIQLNLNKAKKSAANSLHGLLEAFFTKKYADVDKKAKNSAAQVSSVIKDITLLMTKFLQASKVQESKNLFQMSPRELWVRYRNPNMLRTNSEEYLMYKFKQNITPDFKAN